jgi:hypothetical protein
MMNKSDTFDTLEQDQGAEDVTRPIGSGSFGSDHSAAIGESSRGSRKLRSSSLLLAVVVVMSVVGLFSMRTLAKVTAVVTGNQEMERVIDDFLNSSAGRSVFQLTTTKDDAVAHSNQVLEVLNETYTERQVPITDVQKDPFLIFDAAPTPETATAASATDNKPSDIELKRSQRRDQLAIIASRLSLKSVLLGDVPLANINGQIVRPGEIITVMPERQEFEVLAIEAESVRLAAVDLTLGVRIEVDITINRDKQQGGRKR